MAWQKSKKGKEARKRLQTKRKRDLGFIPLNTPFSNSDGHHIDKQHVVYIPHDLHNSISHCLETGKNMEEINQIAMMYLNMNGSKNEK